MQIEVNTSPSLSSSSPIDKKIKCEMLQGVLNIAGFVPVDRKAYKRQKEKREKEALLSSGSGSTGQSLAKQMAVKGQLGKEKVAADVLVESLQEEEVHMLQDVEDEFARAAELAPHMQLVFPAPNAAMYTPLFEAPRYYNMLLLAWLHASRDKMSGAAKRGVGMLLQHASIKPDSGKGGSDRRGGGPSRGIGAAGRAADDERGPGGGRSDGAKNPRARRSSGGVVRRPSSSTRSRLTPPTRRSTAPTQPPGSAGPGGGGRRKQAPTAAVIERRPLSQHAPQSRGSGRGASRAATLAAEMEAEAERKVALAEVPPPQTAALKQQRSPFRDIRSPSSPGSGGQFRGRTLDRPILSAPPDRPRQHAEQPQHARAEAEESAGMPRPPSASASAEAERALAVARQQAQLQKQAIAAYHLSTDAIPSGMVVGNGVGTPLARTRLRAVAG